MFPFKTLLISLVCLLGVVAHAQVDWKHLQKGSDRQFVFRVNTAFVEDCLKKDSIPLSSFLRQQPDYVFSINSNYEDSLPVGHYVVVFVNKSEVVASIEEQTNLVVYGTDNVYNVQLMLRNKAGDYAEQGTAWFDGNTVQLDTACSCFQPDIKEVKKEMLVKIAAGADTTYLMLKPKDDDYGNRNIRSPFRQRWDFFKGSAFYKTVMWLPRQVSALFSKEKRRRMKSSTGQHKGYVLFNQPQYKLTDTVHFKAFIVSPKGKPLTAPLDAYINYKLPAGKNVERLIAHLLPSSPGSYVYQFPLSDSMPLSRWNKLIFKNGKGKLVLEGRYSTDDYLLDEIGKNTLRSNQADYRRNDTIRLYARATDANGQSLLDGKVRLLLYADDVEKTYADVVYVADTLFYAEQKLLSNGETEFLIPTGQLPAADMKLRAKASFVNSSNEVKDEYLSMPYKHTETRIMVDFKRDSVHATVWKDGVPYACKGTVNLSGDIIDIDKQIEFPFAAKVDPLAETYAFTAMVGSDTLKEKGHQGYGRYVSFDRNSVGDTAGFVLSNRNRLPVTYTVFRNSKAIDHHLSSDSIIIWKEVITYPKDLYTVNWQYHQDGKLRTSTNNFAAIYQSLDVRFSNNEAVLPGQKDSITITVSDYKKQPAAHVNVAVAAYNTQFKDKIRVPATPYMATYKRSLIIMRKGYEVEQDFFSSYRIPLGRGKEWLQKFAMDTLPYYTMLFPKEAPYDVPTLIDEVFPQVSVHVTDSGRPQPVFYLLLNNQLVYYKEANSIQPYAFRSFESFARIAFRLKDRLITIDSIYLQPHYKHDLFIDVNKLPSHHLVDLRPDSLTVPEMDIIEANMLQLRPADYLDNAYIKQADRFIKLTGWQNPLVGPFYSTVPVDFYAPGRFHVNFRFEAGYQYSFSENLTRLERQTYFNRFKKYPLNNLTHFEWQLGDTIWTVADSILSPPPKPTVIAIDKWRYQRIPFANQPKGSWRLIQRADYNSDLQYLVVVNRETGDKFVDNSYQNRIGDLPVGKYDFYWVNSYGRNHVMKDVLIKANAATYVSINRFEFQPTAAIIRQMIDSSMMFKVETTKAADTSKPVTVAVGTSAIIGRVIDAKGKLPIANAYINIDRTLKGAAADLNGKFMLSNVAAGTHKITVIAVGYSPKTVEVELKDGQSTFIEVNLVISENLLNEVVVVGYGVQRQSRALGMSTASIIDAKAVSLQNGLTGRVAGLAIRDDGVFAEKRMRLRGIRTVADGNKPVFIIDGILYKQLPSFITDKDLQNATIMKGAEAVAIYGPDAADGAIIISTNAKTKRTIFRDYAFWQPELNTDESGKTSFEVTYPDNITGWELYALAMDGKRRSGRGSAFVTASKPIEAVLRLPQFLLAGDSVLMQGKALNHTASAYTLTQSLQVSGRPQVTVSNQLAAQSYDTLASAISITTTDTLHVNYDIATNTGFKDGEERTIPVFRQGMQQSEGAFYVLTKDTTVSYQPRNDGSRVQLAVQHNTMEMLLKELDNLRSYPYFCMEQTASKLQGLLQEKKINDALHRKDNTDNQISKLLTRLQNNQQYSGGWSWWEKGTPDVYITNYIVNSLLSLRNDSLVMSSIRNGLLFLNSQLNQLDTAQKLSVLYTLSNAGHTLDYTTAMAGFRFSRLNTHQQWQWISVMQQQQLPYQKQLDTLMAKATRTITGGMYWGNENNRWYDDRVATTLLAYRFFKKENSEPVLAAIRQYLLSNKPRGYYMNTVQTAGIISTILPDLLRENEAFNTTPAISVSGDTSFSSTVTPFEAAFKATSPVTIRKQGGGIAYVSLYQNHWNTTPQRKDRHFSVNTYFRENGKTVQQLSAGTPAVMQVDINALEEAQYVMVEIPIPAGCTYNNKPMSYGEAYREYFKDKVVIFLSALSKGKHTISLDLQPRYKGSFVLNPAKVSLMYFPVLNGNNEVMKVGVR